MQSHPVLAVRFANMSKWICKVCLLNNPEEEKVQINSPNSAVLAYQCQKCHSERQDAEGNINNIDWIICLSPSLEEGKYCMEVNPVGTKNCPAPQRQDRQVICSKAMPGEKLHVHGLDFKLANEYVRFVREDEHPGPWFCTRSNTDNEEGRTECKAEGCGVKLGENGDDGAYRIHLLEEEGK
ncbi:hypothetical protein HBI56_114760 [Parastagonospora nodorum]|nr:hypothetical protein HBI10_102930 [Parastagonospora nodorum]KAH4026476.1 hypothetical protein HBI13_062680 [Parastagonospora nodorum]KAH4068082.1 hypothetical protein HBH50_122290 [Parastagonospora nodorum]KAH4085683.1 hypothetical protein HBH48_152870 [Parastagonospora nodorum]KAH4166965.1 hypothetical protein HBH43_131420 [Parastagonospora nodorum]